MPAINRPVADQAHLVVMRVPRDQMDVRWTDAYAFLEGDHAKGTYTIFKGNVAVGAPYTYDFGFSDANTAFEFKLRFS